MTVAHRLSTTVSGKQAQLSGCRTFPNCVLIMLRKTLAGEWDITFSLLGHYFAMQSVSLYHTYSASQCEHQYWLGKRYIFEKAIVDSLFKNKPEETHLFCLKQNQAI